MIEFQVVDLSTLEFHVNGPINPNLATLTLRPPKTVSLCKLHPALTSARRHEPMSRVTSVKKLWPPAWPCSSSSPSTWRTGSGSSWRSIVASYQNMAMFVEVKVCIPESRVSILSPYFTAEFVLLEFGVLWLVSAAAEWDLQADEEEFRSPGRAASWPPPLMTQQQWSCVK